MRPVLQSQSDTYLHGAFEEASMTFAVEPIISVERLAPVTERARAAIGDITSACVVCSLSPPEPGFKLLTQLRERAVAAELQCWPDAERAGTRVWLEFDEHGTASTPPSNWHLWLDASPHAVDVGALIDAGSTGCTAAMVAALRDCLSVLPNGGQLRRLAFLGTRRPAELRVAVSIPEPVVRQYLQQVARSWGASWERRLCALQTWLSPRLTGDSALCQLSIRADGPHEIGVIYSQAQVMLGLDDRRYR